ncbi:MAG: flagellar hook-associated protein FlgK [Lachnospiraceae bacterium]|nr:flagellar hook-associated protein FlgK [Lachnospiraceae bacterium]MDE6185056.1 flagellar hook-associated protein FlgK [Lachnospiraceae bacterium]MDE7286011.1 flagellar hook-associated protein FlgK [Lachnospiraceae bacterium]
MSLFGSLYVGVSGLQMGQNALNTTAHNMSNMDTVGYTRQQVQQGTRFYNTLSTSASAVSYQQVGLGVNYSQVKQVRDYFLDRTYRRESGRSAFYDVSLSAVEEIENLFQELEGEAFADSIENLWGSVQDLARDPGNAVNQGVFVQRCYEFLTRGQAVYQGLCEYQDKLNYKISEQVKTINAYGKRIAELNMEIMKIEGGKIEKANDLKDERNQLIDELSAMGYIDCRTDVDGNVLIKFEGKDFVKMDSANEICLYTDEATGFYTPYWKQLAETKVVNGVETVDIKGAELFNMKQTISTDTNTDIGGLKSMLFARGNKRATFKDLEDADTYDRDISQSIIMNVQAEFDRLMHDVTTGINKILKEAADAATAKNPDSTYMRDEKGNPFTIFNTQTGETDDDAFTVENIIINGEVKQAPSLLGFKKEDGQIDQETADALKNLFTEETHTLNPNVKTTTNYINFYNNLVSQVATTGDVLYGISENQQITVDNTAAAREQILGVSSDEELSNMIMFQNAYNAASRYINVISELMEHVINTLGS